MTQPTGGTHVVAIGGGAFESDGRFGMRPSPLLRYALELTGRDRPRLCVLATALGDPASLIGASYAAFSGRDVQLSHLALFPMPNVDDLRAHVLGQDAVFVGGGSVANLLALWRLHGLDEIFHEAWRAGVVLCGESAGSICWHVGGTTDSFGPTLRPVTNGLGLLPYGNGVHYDGEEQRRPLLQKLVAEGVLPVSYAADNGVGLHYLGTDLERAVSTREGAAAYRVEPDGTGGVRETRIEPLLLS
ncbi:MAG: peptidase E [Streptosporangiales bacterium]|nr:peptidase E [Streptosporangiales bacterium]